MIKILTNHKILNNERKFSYTLDDKGRVIDGKSEKRNQSILIYWLKKNEFLIDKLDTSKLFAAVESEFSFAGKSTQFYEVFQSFNKNTADQERQGVYKSYTAMFKLLFETDNLYGFE